MYHSKVMSGERRRLLRRGAHSVQHPGSIDGRGTCKIQLACAAILVAETFERVAFYSVMGNLVLFLNKDPFLWDSYNAAGASMLLTGVSFIMSLFSGWLADSILGKFRTILLSFLIYLTGYTFLPLLSMGKLDGGMMYNGNTSLPSICGGPNPGPINKWANIEDNSPFISPFQEKCAWLVYLVLCLLAIGIGSLKAAIAPFGADQLKNAGPKAMRAFFNWFYWCVNIGAFIALGGIAYVQQQNSFFYGYLAAYCCLGAATFIFLIGCVTYIKKPASGSVLTNVCKVLCDSCHSSRRTGLPHTDLMISTEMPKPGFLDQAKVQYGGRFTDGIVEDVKTLLKILCVFIALIPYWMVYFQMETTFVIQGLHMRLTFQGEVNVSGKIVEYPEMAVAWLCLFDVIFLIMLIPIMDRLVYPRLDKAGYHFSMVKRMMLGMVFATMAVAVAGGVETQRLHVFWPNSSDPFQNVTIYQKIGNKTEYQAANMSIFWQIPQYALIGISEVFASVAALEFAYSKAPKSMKGIIMGLFFFFSGVGSLLGTATLYAFNGLWFFDFNHGNINCRFHCHPADNKVCKACHLDYYFYFMAALEFSGLLLFMLVVKWLKFGHNDYSGKNNVSPVVKQLDNDSFLPGRGRRRMPHHTGGLYRDMHHSSPLYGDT